MSDPTPNDRTLDAFRLLVRNEDPQRTYQGLHEYAVQSADATTFDGTPTDPAFSPALPTRVPYRPALAGSSCVPADGTLAYVMFANSSPSKPVLVGFGPTLPDSVTIDASATGTIDVGATALLTRIGGADAVALAKAGPIATWAALVNTALAGLGAPVDALVSSATTKVMGK